MQKRELGLPPSGKMSPAEMLYQAKMKELEDWENKLAEKERKLTER